VTAREVTDGRPGRLLVVITRCEAHVACGGVRARCAAALVQRLGSSEKLQHATLHLAAPPCALAALLLLEVHRESSVVTRAVRTGEAASMITWVKRDPHSKKKSVRKRCREHRRDVRFPEKKKRGNLCASTEQASL
jgi:hypothetical protein